MRQAIEEGFILDVVKNYTTYKTYYRLVKAVENQPYDLFAQQAKSVVGIGDDAPLGSDGKN